MNSLSVTLPYLVAAVVAFVCVGFTLVISATRDNYPGWRTWTLSMVAFVAGVAAGLARSPETLLASVLVGNALLGVSGILAVRAFRRFVGAGPRVERALLLALPLVLLGLAYFTAVVPDIRVRVLLITLHTYAAALAVVVMSLRRALMPGPRRVGFVLSAVTFLTIVTLAIPRLFVAFGSPPRALAVLNLSPVLLLLYVTSFVVFVLGGTLSLFVLHDDRRREEVRALHAHLDRLSVTDPLTGLLNRRGLDARAEADGRGPLSLAVLDLDHFKRVNDDHGHTTGDRCLELLARVLQDTTRGSDVIARYGGEEFVLLLPGTRAAEAAAVLERVRSRLRTETARARLPAITLSAGIAERVDQEPLDALFARADALLLAAKQAGRDRVLAEAGVPAA
ncbi:GGDEF domain-containing protein [Deinococcus pimensis]|uniref:GGDEF domain-containing protein n=1 Tax=Deinococcus pimensis TaxID=309888 RepID=UPI0004B0FF07|nr:GGDEF domain-containing protein [Deinococcus pimensis]